MLGLLTLHLRISGCASLKEKRGVLASLQNRLRRNFNVSVAELDFQDAWQDALIGCAMLGNQRAHLDSALQTIARWVEGNWPNGDAVSSTIEIF